MAKRIKINIDTNPITNVNLVWAYSYTPYSNTTGVTIGSGVAIGATRFDTAQNLLDFYNTLILPTFVSFSIVGSIVWIDFDVADDTLITFPYLISGSSDILIEEINTINPVNIPLQNILIRSTYSLRLVPNILFDSAELELNVWNGDINTPPATPSYNLSKSVVQLGQQAINFDINELLKDGIENDVSNYTLSGLQPSNYKMSCWGSFDSNCYDGITNVYQTNGTLFCLYGYGYFSEGFNPTLPSNVLISNNKQTHYRGQDNRLYFLTKDLTSLTINGTAITITANLDLNTEYLQSVNLNDYDSSATTINAVFVYASESRTITYEVKEECRYSILNCVFINKFGVPQSLFLPKVSKYTDDITGSNYRGLLSNFGQYDTTSHLYKDFNLNGRTTFTANTDYLNEIENENVKQMFLSEKKWIIKDSVIYPVNLDGKTQAYKTELNEKLIQYSFTFKNSFDIINQVQ